jgi:hypothetical protein
MVERRESGGQAEKKERKNAGAFVLRQNERENRERHCSILSSSI